MYTAAIINQSINQFVINYQIVSHYLVQNCNIVYNFVEWYCLLSSLLFCICIGECDLVWFLCWSAPGYLKKHLLALKHRANQMKLHAKCEDRYFLFFSFRIQLCWILAIIGIIKLLINPPEIDYLAMKIIFRCSRQNIISWGIKTKCVTFWHLKQLMKPNKHRQALYKSCKQISKFKLRTPKSNSPLG